jgi:hypothetical protein
VRSARALLVAWNAALSTILAVTLVVLAGSGMAFGRALAVCLGVALLLRAGTSKRAIEVVPILAAGGVSLFAGFLAEPTLLGVPAAAAPLLPFPAGIGLVAAGLLLARRRSRRALGRPAWLNLLSTAFAMASVPLALGVLGVFQHLLAIGHNL